MPGEWINVFDVQREAERVLEPGPRGYFCGGAGDEETMLPVSAPILVGPVASQRIELTLGLLGAASPADLGPEHLRCPRPSGVRSEDEVSNPSVSSSS